MDLALKPPPRFGIVQAGVYRSQAFKPDAFDFVETLKLKTLVHLESSSSSNEHSVFKSRAFETFFEENSIKSIAIAGADVDDFLSEELIKETLELCLDVSYHPMLITCRNGVDATGAVVGCLRRMQRWALVSVLDEMRNAASNRRPKVESEYAVEQFDVSIVTVPSRKTLPRWFDGA